MMVGIELVREREGKRAFDAKQRVGERVCRFAREHGLLIRPLGDVVVLMPAPAMDTDTLERLVEGTVATIHEYFERSGT